MKQAYVNAGQEFAPLNDTNHFHSDSGFLGRLSNRILEFYAGIGTFSCSK